MSFVKITVEKDSNAARRLVWQIYEIKNILSLLFSQNLQLKYFIQLTLSLYIFAKDGTDEI